VSAKIGNEAATASQVAAQGIAFDKRGRIIRGDAAWRGASEGSKFLGESPAKRGCRPAARVHHQGAGEDKADGDLRGFSSDQVDQAADRRTDCEGDGGCGETGKVREPGGRDEQKCTLTKHQQHG